MNIITRRDWLKWSAMLAGSLCVGGADERAPKILFFTKSSGYQHSIISRKNNELAYAEKILVDLGKTNGFDIIPSKDGSLFTREKLAEYDAFIFCTTGDLTQSGTDEQPPMPANGKQALLDAIQNGKGFVGLHCASDTFHSQGETIDPYIKMLGGEFANHGAQQDSTTRIIDPKFPGSPQKDFTLKEEWYALKNFTDLHVILMQETTGMQGEMYQRPPYPSTWARMHGKGKVFYTSLAHREDTWKNPLFTDLLMGGIGWVTGRIAVKIP